MTANKPSCRGCQFHLLLPVLGGEIHLCMLPPDCAPPSTTHDHDINGHAWEEQPRSYVGTSCHVMRSKGAVCGPYAALWRRADTSQRSAPSTSKGGDA